MTWVSGTWTPDGWSWRTPDPAEIREISSVTLISTADAAAEMHVAKSTILTWVHRGWLRVAAKAGGKSYYWRADVLKAERRARRGPMVADGS